MGEGRDEGEEVRREEVRVLLEELGNLVEGLALDGDRVVPRVDEELWEGEVAARDGGAL